MLIFVIDKILMTPIIIDTGAEYATKLGPQIITVKAMLDQLSGSSSNNQTSDYL